MTPTPQRGEVWRANLNPQKGSEQSGTCRPVVIIQCDVMNRVGNTVVVVPFTKTIKRAALPSCQFVPAGTGGLTIDSVALCHQIRVLDKKTGLVKRLGTLPPDVLQGIEGKIRFTLAL